MRNLLLLLFVTSLLIFACSSDDSSDTNDNNNNNTFICEGVPYDSIAYGTQKWTVENACHITYRDENLFQKLQMMMNVQTSPLVLGVIMIMTQPKANYITGML